MAKVMEEVSSRSQLIVFYLLLVNKLQALTVKILS
jgi:hypothetical protein